MDFFFLGTLAGPIVSMPPPPRVASRIYLSLPGQACSELCRRSRPEPHEVHGQVASAHRIPAMERLQAVRSPDRQLQAFGEMRVMRVMCVM